ncbi:DMT family transporter [Pseudomonas argentinensis]|uniref:DMT family transporter n=1 Tax=Phytopseudomonas argentinensis TaxID=289370 RepID=UPI000B23BF2F|nr:DMT family transporter [Pseudomonas argentinensis]
MTNEPMHTSAGAVFSSWGFPAAISLLAFAANSILCRLALAGGNIDPESFTAIRLVSGALFLVCLIRLRQPVTALGGSWRGGLSLFFYAYLFSLAYLELEAGAGALILFGAVQITMFVFGWLKGEFLRLQVVLGMLVGFTGLVVLLLPSDNAPPLISALVMMASGIAWGAYSVIGKGSENPLADTTGNFVRSLPMMLAAWILLGGETHITSAGSMYALGSGVLASGAGYSIWYAVVKRISAQQAATLQLSVPVLASFAGVVLLSEPMTWRMFLSSAVVLGGIAIAVIPLRQRVADSPDLGR